MEKLKTKAAQEKLKNLVSATKPTKGKKKKESQEDAMEEEPPKKGVRKRPAADKEDKPKKKPKSSAAPKVNILEVCEHRTLTAEEKEALSDAPLAHKPIGNAKKFVYYAQDKVYKGPYSPAKANDVEALQKVLYRIFRMKNQWGDSSNRSRGRLG